MKSPRNRLIAELLRLRAKANAILLPASQSTARFRYMSRRYKELQGIVNALNAEFPGELDMERVDRYGNNMSALVKYLDTKVEDIASGYDSVSSQSDQSTSSAST